MKIGCKTIAKINKGHVMHVHSKPSTASLIPQKIKALFLSPHIKIHKVFCHSARKNANTFVWGHQLIRRAVISMIMVLGFLNWSLTFTITKLKQIINFVHVYQFTVVLML